MKGILFLLSLILTLNATAGRVHGTVTDQQGNPLGFASIVVKGSTKGAIANSAGKYALTLEPGSYTLVCQYVGYRSEEKKISVGSDDLPVDFRLSVQELKMEAVVVKRGPDPAITIMKETIRKRDFFNNQVDSFAVDVYIKGLLRSRGMPDKFMGQKIDKKDMAGEGIDSTGKGILFLSESVTRVSFTRPDRIKYEVLSSKESGGGYGMSFPFFINFYVNNVSISATNPRGFISPISDNAFHFYTFRYEGNFFEGNKMIDRIRVTPKRKHEPLFDGYIQIVDGEWRIHSLELVTTSEYQLELMDTIRIKQIHAPVAENVWRTQNQVVYVAVKKFGFDITGNFLNVYSNYNLDPGFGKKYFNRIFMSYDSAALKKDSGYWAGTRPVPLEPDEKQNYQFKDSVRKVFRDSFSKANIDSLRKQRRPVKLSGFFVGGVSRNYYGANGFTTYRFSPLLPALEYNTVEGLAINLVQSLQVRPKNGNRDYTLQLHSRYGISNEHVNGYLTLSLKPNGEDVQKRNLVLSGGKRIMQINPDNPIDPLTNSLYTLFVKKNYIKLYENWFGQIDYDTRTLSGLQLGLRAVFEDRIPLNNTTDFTFFKKESLLLPNHPYELAGIPFGPQQALVTSASISYQPGQRYIQYPNRLVAMGSKYPTLQLQYTKGIPGWAGSDADFDKWKFSVFDHMNLKLGGAFRYRISTGGFWNNRSVGLPDLQHFNGNQTFFNGKYGNSFQLAPYYQYSNAEELYGLVHAEHHFNGLLTNKIPLFNRLKWNLVAGANTFYVNRDRYYVEAFAGLENIFKILRVDVVTAFQSGPGNQFGIRVGMGGVVGGLAQVNTR